MFYQKNGLTRVIEGHTGAQMRFAPKSAEDYTGTTLT